jgi:phosphatidylglycerophosphate synthase
VGSDHHVGAALEYPELGFHGARGLAHVRRGDDVEDDLARRGDRHPDRPEGTDPPSHTQVDGQRAAHERPVARHRCADPDQTEDPAHAVSVGVSGRAVSGAAARSGVDDNSPEVLASDADPRSGASRAAAQAYSPRPLTDGERWTVDALVELRVGGYRPRAWLRFVDRSLERSAQARRARPEMAMQVRRWTGVGGAGWLVACHLARGRPDVRLNRGAGLAWWLAVGQMLDWHLGMAEGGDGVRRERLSPADALTLARFWLVPLVAGVRDSRRGLPAAIAAGGLTDWLDGALARRHGRTRLGRDLDTTADLALLTTAAIAARSAGRLPKLGASALGARHAAGLALALAAVLGRARRPAIRARPAGAALRVGGLLLAVAGAPRIGTTLLVTGCATPPRSTAPHLSPA